ncbi:hypothetical protein Tco_0450803 [Tanacetum coccineum]
MRAALLPNPRPNSKQAKKDMKIGFLKPYTEEENECNLPRSEQAATRVPTKRKSRCNQESINIRGTSFPETEGIRRVKTVREVTGSPNQKDTGQTPTKMISLSLRMQKETLSQHYPGISISQDKAAQPTSRHMMEARIDEHIRSIPGPRQRHKVANSNRFTCSTQRSPNVIWFDKLPRESIDSYEDLRTAFRKIISNKQNTSRIRWRYIISSKEMENPRRTLWKDTKQKIQDVRSNRMPEDLRNHARVTTSFLQGEAVQSKSPQSFSPETTISFPSLGGKIGMEGPMIVEAEIVGHYRTPIIRDEVRLKISYEHCFAQLLAKSKKPDGPSYHINHRNSVEKTVGPLGHDFAY